MKKLLFAIAMLTALSSCNEMGKCTDIDQSVMTMLFDVSDEQLFTEIEGDLKANFAQFMKQTKFATIGECEEAELVLGTLSAKDELEIRKATVGLTQKGLSGQEKRNQANPAKVVQLIKSSLAEYAELSKLPTYNSSTNILQTTVKSIVAVDESTQQTLVIFSDMVANNKIEGINFYRSVPKDVGGTVRKLVDSELLNQLESKVSNGLEVNLIVVLKNEPNNKIKKKDVKEFWSKCFSHLGLEQVQFIDNLSNNIEWN
jgi:hypothetical protein